MESDLVVLGWLWWSRRSVKLQVCSCCRVRSLVLMIEIAAYEGDGFARCCSRIILSSKAIAIARIYFSVHWGPFPVVGMVIFASSDYYLHQPPRSRSP